MWPFAGKVRCVDCGFLGRAFDEPPDRALSYPARNVIRERHLTDWVPYCHRGVIEFSTDLHQPEYPVENLKQAVLVAQAKRHREIFEMADEPRLCPHFQRFSPGRGFQAHYDSWERASEARRNRAQQTLLVLLSVSGGFFLGKIGEIVSALQGALRGFGVIP